MHILIGLFIIGAIVLAGLAVFQFVISVGFIAVAGIISALVAGIKRLFRDSEKEDV